MAVWMQVNKCFVLHGHKAKPGLQAKFNSIVRSVGVRGVALSQGGIGSFGCVAWQVMPYFFR